MAWVLAGRKGTGRAPVGLNACETLANRISRPDEQTAQIAPSKNSLLAMPPDEKSAQQSARVRIALVGCGRMGVLHSERLADDGRGRLVSLFDVDGRAAESIRERFAAS